MFHFLFLGIKVEEKEDNDDDLVFGAQGDLLQNFSIYDCKEDN